LKRFSASKRIAGESGEAAAFCAGRYKQAAKNKAGSAVCLTALPVLCFGE
jgi:hypothetical protein